MTNLKFFFITFVMLSVLQIGYSQTGKLFEKIPNKKLHLSPVESQRLSKISSKPFYSEIKIVELGNLSRIQENGFIRVDLENSNCGSVKYKAKTVEYSTDENFYWYGSLVSKDTCECSEGTLTLMAKEGRTFGYFSVDDDAYDIEALSINKSTVSKIDNSKLTDGECGVTAKMERKEKKNVDTSVENRGSNGHCNVRALVLYTDAANDAEANIQDRIDFFVARTNQALENSGVSSCKLRILLAGDPIPIPIPFAEGIAIENDLNTLADDDTIKNLREIRHADIVILLTNGNYVGNSGGNIFGFAFVGATKEEAYTIVEVDFPNSRFTFAHEVAHLFGAGHEDDERVGIPHAKQFLKCFKRKRTILRRTGKIGRIQHYSNPKVKYKGKKTGTKGKRDNAHQLINKACFVANFENDETFYTSIWSQNDNNPEDIEVSSVCPCGITQLEAKYFGPPNGADVQYEWRISTNGINYGDILSVNKFFGLNTYDMCDHEGSWCFDVCLDIDIFVQLKSTGPNGEIRKNTRHFVTASTWPEQNQMTQSCIDDSPMIGSSNSKGSALQSLQPLNELSVYPNPTKDNIVISMALDFSNHVLVNLYHIGSKEKTLILDKVVDKGSFSFTVNTGNLPNGVYFINALIGDKILTRKFVVQK